MRNTMEAWATPVDAPVLKELADHTFVMCDGVPFKCWGGSDTTHKDAVKVVSGSGDKSLCKANNYRGLLDSACLGIYAVNGVCHQSTNLFLHAVDKTMLPLNKARPHGVLASHALYGVYGACAPGRLETAPAFFIAWLTTVYNQAYWRCVWPFKATGELTDDMVLGGMEEDSLVYKICNNSYRNDLGDNAADDIVVSDMGIILDHFLQMPEHPVYKTHVEIIGDKNNLLTRYGLTGQEISEGNVSLSAADVKGISSSLNELSIAFQDALKMEIGKEAYIAANGDEKFYSPVNPDIAVEVLHEMPNR